MKIEIKRSHFGGMVYAECECGYTCHYWEEPEELEHECTNEYACDKCRANVPDGAGRYSDSGDRVCPSCEEQPEACKGCGGFDDVQGGLCAACYEALPEAEWVTVGA